MSFLFVDTIESLDERAARGRLQLWAGSGGPPSWLIIEAIGQLAGWIAIQHTDFASRPVAALAGEVVLDPIARVDATPVELAAAVDRFDGRAILYHGCATIGGHEVGRVTRCVGPLLPLELFDDPAAMRARLVALRTGIAPQRAAPPGPPPLDVVTGDGAVRQARLRVPADAPYFADHFPRRPVFPATLLAAALDALAAPAAAAALGVPAAQICMVRDLKVRAFSEPGQALSLGADCDAASDGRVAVRVHAAMDDKRTATARFIYRAAP